MQLRSYVVGQIKTDTFDFKRLTMIKNFIGCCPTMLNLKRILTFIPNAHALCMIHTSLLAGRWEARIIFTPRILLNEERQQPLTIFIRFVFKVKLEGRTALHPLGLSG